MTSAEHLIEAALICLEEGRGVDDFLNSKTAKLNSKDTNIDLITIMQMAQHVYYYMKPNWDTRAVAEYLDNCENA